MCHVDDFMKRFQINENFLLMCHNGRHTCCLLATRFVSRCSKLFTQLSWTFTIVGMHVRLCLCDLQFNRMHFLIFFFYMCKCRDNSKLSFFTQHYKRWFKINIYKKTLCKIKIVISADNWDFLLYSEKNLNRFATLYIWKLCTHTHNYLD